MVILGIDPGTAITGYCILITKQPKNRVQDRNEKPRVVDFGCITTPHTIPMEQRLKMIYEEVSRLLTQHKPDIVSVENLFFFKNLKTAIPVSQAKGIILLAAANSSVPVREFTPLEVKMTVVGYGRAEKKQVQAMTKHLLDLSDFDLKEKGRKNDDASDALGVALCAFLKHAQIM